MVFELISIKLLCIICSSLAIFILSLGCFLSIAPVQGKPYSDSSAEEEGDVAAEAVEDEGDAEGDAAEENGGKFFFGKKPNRWGGSEGGLTKDQTISGFFF